MNDNRLFLMRFIWGAIVMLSAAAILLGACRKSEPWPADIVQNFMNACRAQGASSRICACVVKELQQRMTLKEYTESEAAMRMGQPGSKKILQAVAACRKTATR
ncbi:MAG: hypothetical protein NTX64_17260 [Elusimicrobia bacterium]|nr:hypothetical protein [Elusimicrobiota bacterium]